MASKFAQGIHNVQFKVEITDVSNKPLIFHQNYINAGHLDRSPSSVYPDGVEAFSGHKSGNTATGCSGTVSWKIGDTGKIIVLMYSIPYSHDLHSNWLAVGIFREQDTTNFYSKMYYDAERSFKRKEFYYDTHPLKYSGNSVYEVVASMGTSHKPEISVLFSPKDERNLSPKMKKKLVS